MQDHGDEFRSTDELVSLALTQLRDGQEAWPEIVALQSRGGQSVYDAAVALTARPEPTARQLGVIVLRELGATPREGDRPYRQQIVQLLMELLEHERDLNIQGWIISALGYHGAYEGVSKILSFASSGTVELRFRVAAALPSLNEPEGNNPAIVSALESLTQDEDADIRYYALSGLKEMDVPFGAIATTLSALHTDRDPQVRQLARDYRNHSQAESPIAPD